MKTHHCCQMAKPEDNATPRRTSRWRRGGETAGWIIPSAALILMPKCPMCVAAYVALFSGVGISVANASTLRTGLLIVCVATLLCLTLKWVCRRVAQNKALLPAQNQIPARETCGIKP